MQLNELLKAKTIVVQCHNDPDADAIASGWGLYQYFHEKQKNVRLIYGGSKPISKKNLLLMVDLLNIPIEYVTALDEEPDLLLTADCQPGERNVQTFAAKQYAAVDHHRIREEGLAHLCAYEIKENYGACATLVWNLLCAEKDFTPSGQLATALYYGLFMDTCKLQEIYQQEDRIVRNKLEKLFDESIQKKLITHNLNLSELTIVGKALENVTYNEKYRFAIAEAEPCDPNILGIISDQINEVDGIDICVIFTLLPIGAKLSVRSCIGQAQANEIAHYLANGGGHKQKAGGMLTNGMLTKNTGITEITGEAVTRYLDDLDIIIAGQSSSIDLSDAPMYQKRRYEIGFVHMTDVYHVGDKIRLMTLEGDVDRVVDDNLYVMIGIEHEVYDNTRDYFESHNEICDEPFSITEQELSDVERLVCGVNTDTRSIAGHIGKCFPKTSQIRAVQASRPTKILAKYGNWLSGEPGDYIVSRAEDPTDMYIVQKRIFEKTYEPLKMSET